mgnify:CR=1 FL=1
MKLLGAVLLAVLVALFLLLCSPATRVAAQAEMPDVVGLSGYEAKAVSHILYAGLHL